MCDAFLVLAQTEAGISCFLLPRFTPDGERNGFHIQRLKDKLGNRSNASSEVEFRGAWAQMVGEEGRGVPTIIEMVNHTRLDCTIGSRAGMRAGVAQAIWHAAHRSAFGKRLIDQPLMQQRARRPRGRVRGRDGLGAAGSRASSTRPTPATSAPALVRRIATPVLKYWICKRAPSHAVEALECLGGNGYVEESGMPRLFRESPLNVDLGGLGQRAGLDVAAGDGQEPGRVEAFFDEIGEAAGTDAAARPLRRRPSTPSSPTPRDSSRAPAASSSGWRSRCRARCWSATATRPSPTPSAPPASTATGATPSARCPPASTPPRSSSATRPALSSSSGSAAASGQVLSVLR